MMGRQSRQMAMIFVDIESLIPETHLLRKIERMVSFNFIYDLLAPYYPATGRPSVDPVSMFKMLLIGYLYGIKSERRLVEEVQLNIAYRWFCGFELDDTIPNHSTFSKTRTRKWQQSDLFQKAFYEIVKQCIDSGLIDGEAMAADGSYIPANVSRESWINVEIEVEQSMQSYLDSLDEELSNQPGFKKPPTKIVRKCRTTSQTDPDSGYINHGSKRGIGYLMEATVDCKHGILTGVDVSSANEKERLLVLRHLERQINLGIPMSRLALDRGYETGAVHRGLELLGITGYIPAIQFSNPPEKYGFSYDPQLDAFICPEGVPLTYHRLNCSKSTGKYLRCYQVEGNVCMHCPKRPSCFDKAGIRRRVLASSCYPAFFRGHQRVGTPEYLTMMRLRKIWAEGSFSVLKREHCISRIRKRGILAATEECLLAAMALNLKRMVNAIFRYPQIYCSAGTTVGSSSFFAFVNRSVIGHYPATYEKQKSSKSDDFEDFWQATSFWIFSSVQQLVRRYSDICWDSSAFPLFFHGKNVQVCPHANPSNSTGLNSELLNWFAHTIVFRLRIRGCVKLQQPVIFRQHLHLADGDGVEFCQSLRLRHSLVDENRIQVLQVG